MNNNPLSKRIIVIVISIILLPFIVLLGLKIYHDKTYTATLDIEYSPSVATVMLNGQKAKAGTVQLRPGTATVTASRTGFGTQTQNVSLKAGSTTYAGIILIPNSASTTGWYSSHHNDEVSLEKISTKLSTVQGDASWKQLPIIQYLPYIGAGFTYRIDYGQPSAGASGPIGLYVTYYAPNGKQLALGWIQQRGYDPSKLNIS